MDQHTARPAEFSAVLKPHRSLSPRAFGLLMATVGGISFTAGVFFVALGAWPVFGFLGLEVLILYLAFRRSFADAEAREVVEVTPHEVVLYRLRPGRTVRELRFARPWVEVELEEDSERELIGSLGLRYGGRLTEFANFLPPDERKSLAAALRAAMAGGRV